MTERIASLKEKLFSMEEETVFLERLFLLRQGYDKYKDRSPSVRYALILDEILSGMSVVLDPDDLIAGRVKETIPTDEEEKTIEEIGRLHRVHRMTVTRWIAGIRKMLLEETRRQLARRLDADASEVNSIVGVLRSQLDASIQRFLT